jgi:hypothetical protein
MPFVMVPVPEQYVTDVMQLVVDMIRSAPEHAQWDAPTVQKFFSDADEASRSALSAIARGVVAGMAVTDEYVAGVLQLDMQDTVAIIEQINVASERAGMPALVTKEDRLLSMPADVARMVQAAEGEER